MSKAKKKRPRRAKYSVNKGDRAVVISGDWVGVEGVVSEVDRKNGRVTLEGVNLVSRHLRPTQRTPEGGVFEREAPLHISKVRVIEESVDEWKGRRWKA